MCLVSGSCRSSVSRCNGGVFHTSTVTVKVWPGDFESHKACAVHSLELLQVQVSDRHRVADTPVVFSQECKSPTQVVSTKT